MIKTKILSFLRKNGLVYKKWTSGNVLDKSYKVIKGSIRSYSDNDDAWLFALGKECENIFDIGSNIGQAALMLLYHKNIKHIVLVDPNPQALSIASENLIHNNLSMKASFVCAFISDQNDSTVEFYTQDSGAAGSIYKGFAKTAAKTDSHFSVKTLTLDYLSEFYNTIPELIKIDVEGAERSVLKGAVKLASKAKTSFFVEIHSGPELSIIENTQGILDWCSENNYTAWYLKTKAKLSIDSITKRGRYHALLLPVDKPLPEFILKINEKDHISI